MKVIMTASYYYPIQDVSSLRIHSYCKALVQKGVDVTVFMIYPIDGQHREEGVFEGVKYRWLAEPKYYFGGRVKKLYYRLSGIFNLIKIIFSENLIGVLTYHDNFFTNFFIKAATTFKKYPFIIDKTEYPYNYSTMSKFRKYLEKLNLSLFDGIIVITSELKEFYLNFTKNVFLLPMTIDPDRFNNVSLKKQVIDPYIGLTFGVHNRDGLLESVRSFHKYLQISDIKLFKLYLIGDYETLTSNFPDCLEIQNYITNHRLQDSVLFIGKIPIDQVPRFLAEASVLITTPNSYSSGGFPTKVGEYMLSGTPLVATRAGEISNYLSDSVDAYLCEVGNLTEVAEKIKFIEDNPTIANEIAINAMETAKTKFNAATYTDELLCFIKSIKI